jgi:hypothetical protein
MKPIRSKPLIVAVIVISVAIIAITQFGQDGSWSLRTRQIAGFSAFGLNAAVALLGCWTQYRAGWVAYLVASLAFMFLIGAATPPSGLWLLTRVLFDSLSRG